MALHLGGGKGPAHLSRIGTNAPSTPPLVVSTAGTPVGLLLILTKAS